MSNAPEIQVHAGDSQPVARVPCLDHGGVRPVIEAFG
jgi:hypothetical protein